MDVSEKTLALIKPDAVRNGKAEEIKQLIELTGFTIVKKEKIQLTRARAQEFYGEHDGKPFFVNLVNFMTSGPIWAMILSKPDAIKAWRELMGPTNTFKAREEKPTSLRALYGTDGTQNATHGSDSPASAEREIKFFFPKLIPEPLPSNDDAQAYIKANLEPTLVKALTALAKEKPTAEKYEAITFLSNWLLAHNPNKPQIVLPSQWDPALDEEDEDEEIMAALARKRAAEAAAAPPPPPEPVEEPPAPAPAPEPTPAPVPAPAPTPAPPPVQELVPQPRPPSARPASARPASAAPAPVAKVEVPLVVPALPGSLPEDTTIVFVLGGPGSGKGTQCERIVANYGFKHLSAGDLLRAEVASGSDVGKACQALMTEGKLVPQSVTIALLKNAMLASGASQFLIDGFPRAMDQALEFESSILPAKAVLFFDCPEEEMERRLMKRGETSGRADDNAETIRKRFRTFIDQSLPVKEHYLQIGNCSVISAVPPPDIVFMDVANALDALGFGSTSQQAASFSAAEEEPEKFFEGEDPEELAQAATKLQAVFKGKQARKEVEKMKLEASASAVYRNDEAANHQEASVVALEDEASGPVVQAGDAKAEQPAPAGDEPEAEAVEPEAEPEAHTAQPHDEAGLEEASEPAADTQHEAETYAEPEPEAQHDAEAEMEAEAHVEQSEASAEDAGQADADPQQDE